MMENDITLGGEADDEDGVYVMSCRLIKFGNIRLKATTHRDGRFGDIGMLQHAR